MATITNTVMGEIMSDDYSEAHDALASAIRAAKGRPPVVSDDLGEMTVDQRLKVAEITALLSIAQELSGLNPQNTSVFKDGHKVNGWGFPAAN